MNRPAPRLPQGFVHNPADFPLKPRNQKLSKEAAANERQARTRAWMQKPGHFGVYAYETGLRVKGRKFNGEPIDRVITADALSMMLFSGFVGLQHDDGTPAGIEVTPSGRFGFDFHFYGYCERVAKDGTPKQPWLVEIHGNDAACAFARYDRFASNKNEVIAGFDPSSDDDDDEPAGVGSSSDEAGDEL